MRQMTYVQAQRYAAEHKIIARIDRPARAVNFYTGNEDDAETWIGLGRAIVRGGVLDARTVEMICAKVRR